MTRNIKIVITISLVLNLLLAGILVGTLFHQMSRKASFKNTERTLAAQLSPEKRERFQDVMTRMRAENREIRQQIRETRERALAILAAPQFDERSFQTEVDMLHDLRGRMMRNVANATMELAQQFDPEERKVLGRYLKRPPPP